MSTHDRSTHDRFDAIVIGAGPAGATAAILLARAGWSVALVEKREFPRRKVCGECIAASNLGLLDALGLGAQFAAIAGPPLSRVALMAGRDTLVAPMPALADGPHRFGRALGREHLDTMLAARARALGATLLQPCTVRAVAGTHGDWRCEVVPAEAAGPSDGARLLRAPVLVSAHGSWDPQPKGLLEACAGPDPDPDPPKRPGDLFAFKSSWRDARLAPGLLPVLSFPGGYGGIVLGDHGIVTLACCIRRDALQAIRKAAPGVSAAEAVDAHLRDACAGVADALRGARRSAAWLSVGPIRPGIRIGRAPDAPFAIGNAAGETHPIIGEGISMAMQSAFMLAERLLADDGGPVRDAAALRAIAIGHADAWRSAFAPRLRLAAVLSHLAMRPWLARPLLPLLRARPALMTLAARVAGKARCAVTPQALPATEPAIRTPGESLR